MKIIRACLLVCLGLLVSIPFMASAEEGIVRSIVFEGNKKTRSARMLQFMDTQVGSPFDNDDFLGDLERLRSWMFFESVEGEVATSLDGEVDVTIRMKEKWTILPAFDVKFGGGVYQVILGALDNNFLGNKQQLLAYGGVRSGDWLANVRFQDERILGSKVGVFLDLNREFYEDPYYESDDDTSPVYEAVVERIGGLVLLEYEIAEELRIGLAGQYTYDKIKAGEESRRKDPPNSLDSLLMKETPSAALGFWLKAGKVTVDNYIYKGIMAESLLLVHDKVLGSYKAFESFTADLRFYVPIPGKMNLTGKLYTGIQNSHLFQEQFTLGGFQNLRGYVDRRFRGDGIGFINLEYRWMAFSVWWFSFMPVAFFDGGTVWNDPKQAFDLSDHLHASAGLGMRWIINKWDVAIIRTDFAQPLTDEFPFGFSIGMGMLF